MKISILRKGRTKRPLKVCRPLDEIVVRVVGGRGCPAKIELRVMDGARRPYVITESRLKHGQASFSFLAGGRLGRHHMVISSPGRTRTAFRKSFVLEAESGMKTGGRDYGALFDETSSMLKNLSSFSVNGKRIRGISWLRDHVHCMKGTKYWQKEMKDMVDYFLEHQMDDGAYYDFFAKKQVANNDFAAYFPEKDVTFWRIDCEADLEYLMVEAAHTVWQATGDDDWLKARLRRLENGLTYSMTNPERWSRKHRLVKRPFTIDTWDFENSAAGGEKDGKAFLRTVEENGFIIRRIDERTRFCIMHGDNSGFFKACRLLGGMCAYFGDMRRGAYWRKQADGIRERANRICWNGKFYTHQVHLDPIQVPVDERRQLSLSNPYDINRGLPGHRQAVSIIQEYRRRRKIGAFAEWFSIDPPFPTGVFPKMWGDAGEYINGTVMPLVAGELAKACFDHGFEEYGDDILRRLSRIIMADGKMYFMYNRNGRPWMAAGGGGPPEWGAAAVSHALMEGLAGIEDVSQLYRDVRVSPRWAVTKERDVSVTARYAASGGYFAYRYRLTGRANRKIIIDFAGSGNLARFHVLLPEKTRTESVYARGGRVKWRAADIEKSRYTDFELPTANGKVTINLKTSVH